MTKKKTTIKRKNNRVTLSKTRTSLIVPRKHYKRRRMPLVNLFHSSPFVCPIVLF